MLQENSLISTFNSDGKYCLLPFSDQFARKCTAICAVSKKHGYTATDLTSTSLNYPLTLSGNVVESAINEWINGGENPFCSFIYENHPCDDLPTTIQTINNVDRISCGGRDV